MCSASVCQYTGLANLDRIATPELRNSCCVYASLDILWHIVVGLASKTCFGQVCLFFENQSKTFGSLGFVIHVYYFFSKNVEQEHNIAITY